MKCVLAILFIFNLSFDIYHLSFNQAGIFQSFCTKSPISPSFSLRPSVYFCGLCVETTVKRRESRDTQRNAEKPPPKTRLLCKAIFQWKMTNEKRKQCLHFFTQWAAHQFRNRLAHGFSIVKHGFHFVRNWHFESGAISQLLHGQRCVDSFGDFVHTA